MAPTAVAVAVVGASTAYACTVWVGQFAVSADTPGHHGNGVSWDQPYEQVVTYGTGIGMDHCSMEGGVRLNVDAGTTQQIRIDYRAINPSTRPATCANLPFAMRAPKNGSYTLSYLNTGWGDFVGGNTGGGTWSAGHGTTPDPFTDHYDNDLWEEDRRLQREYVRSCAVPGGSSSTWSDPSDVIVSNGVVSMTRTVTAKPASPGGGTVFPDLSGPSLPSASARSPAPTPAPPTAPRLLSS